MRVFITFVLFLFAGIAVAEEEASVCIKATCIKVEVMKETEDLARGLQGREGLADHEGMLFVFEGEGRYRFWMKKMKFPIDMIWLDSHKRIVTIASSCPPCIKEPCKVYGSSEAAQYILEVPAGYARKHHFTQGDVFKFNLG